MKRVEELGISPHPWNALGEADESESIIHYVHDSHGRDINDRYLMQADARLIAAAPELYECLREAVIEVCHNFTCCGSSDDGYSCNGERECFVAKWRAVLAKAGGEKKGDAE